MMVANKFSSRLKFTVENGNKSGAFSHCFIIKVGCAWFSDLNALMSAYKQFP